MGKNLIINEGKEFMAHILGPGEGDKNDIFYSKYVEAKNIFLQLYKEDDNDSNKQMDYEYQNNIIAFCGDRGTGKTSAMINFGKSIMDAAKRKESNKVLSTLWEDDNLSESYIANNILIDPTMLMEHNILDIVVATMYGEVQNEWNLCKDTFYKDQEKKKIYIDLINQFQTVYRNLSLINNQKSLAEMEYDCMGSIEKLARLGESASLKKEMIKLVEYYLEYMQEAENCKDCKASEINVSNKNSYNRGMLLVQIDDVDLCNQNAFKMMEQIRKYLVIPKVIILMAVRIEQLEMCVQEENYGHYRNLYNVQRDSVINEVKQMSLRYLLKLIPETRRIVLDGQDFKPNDLHVFYNPPCENINNNTPLFECICKLMEDITGMEFIKSDLESLMPQSLRGIINYLVFLKQCVDDMGDSSSSESERSTPLIDYLVKVILRDKAELQEKYNILESLYKCSSANMHFYLKNCIFYENESKEISLKQIMELNEYNELGYNDVFGLAVQYIYAFKWKQDFYNDRRSGLLELIGKDIWEDVFKEVLGENHVRCMICTLDALNCISGEYVFDDWIYQKNNKMVNRPRLIEDRMQRKRYAKSIIKLLLFMPVSAERKIISRVNASFIDAEIQIGIENFFYNILDMQYLKKYSGIEYLFGENDFYLIDEVISEIEKEYGDIAKYLIKLYCNPRKLSKKCYEIKMRGDYREKSSGEIDRIDKNLTRLFVGLFNDIEMNSDKNAFLLKDVRKNYVDMCQKALQDKEKLYSILLGKTILNEDEALTIIHVPVMQQSNRTYKVLRDRLKIIINNIGCRNRILRKKNTLEDYIGKYEKEFKGLIDFYKKAGEKKTISELTTSEYDKFLHYKQLMEEYISETDAGKIKE